ncbi:MAG: hypothetical protein ACFUZC_06720 [Chthoniobacteraceae bacterium]
MLAPTLGLGIYGAVGIPVFSHIPFRAPFILALVGLLTVASVLIGKKARPIMPDQTAPRPAWFVLLAIVALLPVFMIVPHSTHEKGWVFGAPVFDHVKIAVVDSIARSGLPPVNPYYSETQGGSPEGKPPGLYYYYLTLFVTSNAVKLLPITGFEADIAMTYVVAAISLLTVSWVAIAVAGNCAVAWWILPIALISQLRLIVEFISGPYLPKWVSCHGVEPWIIQAAWVHQHLFAATLALVALVAFTYVISRPQSSLFFSLIWGTLSAAAYASSVYVGMGLALCYSVLVLFYFSTLWANKGRALLHFGLALAVSVACSLSLILQQAALAGQRKVMAVQILHVLHVKAGFQGNLSNGLAYWFVLLLVDFGFLYLMTWLFIFCRKVKRDGFERDLKTLLCVAFFVPLIAGQFLCSIIANNDLGWRIILPAALAMMIAAATVTSEAIRGQLPKLKTAVLFLMAVTMVPGCIAGLHFTFNGIACRLNDKTSPQMVEFGNEPALWRDVRSVTSPDERVLNNPMANAGITPWPTNLGWALFSDRSHCAAAYDLLRSYAPSLTKDGVADRVKFFDKFFSGDIQPDDLRMIKEHYHCATLVVTKRDGLWDKPILEHNDFFHLVLESPKGWRIYR